MKKIFTLIGLSFLMITAKGQLPFHEPFNYTPDPTLGLWTQSSAAWLRINTGDSILVTSGNLNYSGLPSSTGNKISFDGGGSDYYRIVTPSPVTSGSVYYSFILNVSSLGGLTATGGYFTSIAQAASTTSYGTAIWTRLSATAGKFNIGVSTRSNSAVSWLTADLDPGTSYFIVSAYDIISGTANDVARIWLNTSAIGGAEPAADITAAPGTDLSASGIDKILVRQDNTTNTPFINMDELRVGTTWADVTPSGAVPSLSISSPLASFGNVCINTTAGPNTFTISGSNLTTANVNVAALNGFEYATSSGGPYTSTLSITQPGGSFTQQVFVRFTPIAVQSYNGNIAVNGGGVTTPVNAAAVGTGVNTAPSVTTGGASSITLTSATAAGSIPATGCTAITAYGIEYSTTAGFPNGTGIQVASSNLSGGNFSSNLTGLASGTTHYYKAYATNAGGTTYGTEQSFTTLTPNPTINTTALTAFGNVCINTTAGPNSFTITGSNLTTANVTVGPLAGYTFSTTSGGTYTASLNLSQPGGSYSQQVFVRFTPTAVQSYNGNIPVNGGGIAAPVNVAASGAGVNTTASVTTGAVSAITQTSATAAGSITAIGCSAVTAYGIEYSTTNNFPLGSGIQVASSNLSGSNFSSNLTGLTPSTTFYYRAYATNGGGTAYGSQLSFTTAAPTLSVTALSPFGNVCINTISATNSFTITGVGLTNANVNIGPLAGYSFSTTTGGTYTASLSLTQPGGAYNQVIYVRINPTLVQSYAGNIPVTGGGAAAANVAADGNGVNTLATVVTGATSNITNHSAVLAGSIPATGCSNVSAYGIEFSGINGFGNGTGTKVASANLSSGSYTTDISGLVQGATYYYKAYATNNGGTSYGLQQSFTVASIADGFSIYPAPAQRGGTVRVTKNDLKPGYYGLLIFNSAGQLVFQQNINIQANFINQQITLPGSLMSGAYRVILVNNDDVIATKTIHIF
jgi:hypothetical protein